MKKQDERAARLMDCLNGNFRMSLHEAVDLLDVSESTARRLFDQLERSGQAIRVHGGIQLLRDEAKEYSFDRVENLRLAEKRRIAAALITSIGEASSLYLDSGSTLAQVSGQVARAIKDGRLRDLTIFTNSLKNLEALEGFCPVHVIGGEYRTHRQDFCGFLAESALAQLHFDICILGTDGYDDAVGFTATDFQTARLNAMVVERSRHKMVAADSGKFTGCSMVAYAAAESIDMVVTDQGISESALNSLMGKDIKVMRV